MSESFAVVKNYLLLTSIFCCLLLLVASSSSHAQSWPCLLLIVSETENTQQSESSSEKQTEPEPQTESEEQSDTSSDGASETETPAELSTESQTSENNQQSSDLKSNPESESTDDVQQPAEPPSKTDSDQPPKKLIFDTQKQNSTSGPEKTPSETPETDLTSEQEETAQKEEAKEDDEDKEEEEEEEEKKDPILETLSDFTGEEKKLLPVIVASFIDQTGVKNNGEQLADIATLMVEEYLAKIPGLAVIPQDEWQKLFDLSQLFDEQGTSTSLLDKLKENNLLTAIVTGEILSLQERCLGGGCLFFGVRKMEYTVTVHIKMMDFSKNVVIFSRSRQGRIVDKSIGFKRKDVRLSVPAAQILLKPALDSIMLSLYNSIQSGLMSTDNDTPK